MYMKHTNICISTCVYLQCMMCTMICMLHCKNIIYNGNKWMFWCYRVTVWLMLTVPQSDGLLEIDKVWVSLVYSGVLLEGRSWIGFLSRVWWVCSEVSCPFRDCRDVHVCPEWRAIWHQWFSLNVCCGLFLSYLVTRLDYYCSVQLDQQLLTQLPELEKEVYPLQGLTDSCVNVRCPI